VWERLQEQAVSRSARDAHAPVTASCGITTSMAVPSAFTAVG